MAIAQWGRGSWRGLAVPSSPDITSASTLSIHPQWSGPSQDPGATFFPPWSHQSPPIAQAEIISLHQPKPMGLQQELLKSNTKKPAVI